MTLQTTMSSQPIIIPFNSLSPDALQGVIEDFVLREGTDYGHREFSLEQKVLSVTKELEAGKLSIAFDPESSTCTILTSREVILDGT